MRSVRFDQELDERVQRAAAREGLSVSEFIRAAVAERADVVLRGESVLDAWGDYIGSVAAGGDARNHKAEFAAIMEGKQERQQAG